MRCAPIRVIPRIIESEGVGLARSKVRAIQRATVCGGHGMYLCIDVGPGDSVTQVDGNGAVAGKTPVERVVGSGRGGKEQAEGDNEGQNVGGHVKMVVRTSSTAIDEHDDDELTCKKMKSLSQIQDTGKVEPNKDEDATEECDDEQKEQEEEKEEGEEQEEEGEKPRPIGDVIRVFDDGGVIKKYFEAFEFDGANFHLEDPVLVSPEEKKRKPSVAIIKDIFQTEDGEMMIRGQRFYRPDEAENEEGGTWQTQDPRELFYSDHLDDLPADTVMHRCVIHLVPSPNPLPIRKQNPGFMVQKVYDPVHRKLRDLADEDCRGSLTKKGMDRSDPPPPPPPPSSSGGPTYVGT